MRDLTVQQANWQQAILNKKIHTTQKQKVCYLFYCKDLEKSQSDYVVCQVLWVSIDDTSITFLPTRFKTFSAHELGSSLAPGELFFQI